MVLATLIPISCFADTIGLWNQGNDTVEYPAGTVIGIVEGGVAVSTVPPRGILLNEPPFSLTHVMGSNDGVLYVISADGHLRPAEEEDDDQGNSGIIGILGINGGNAGASGSSGSSGSGDSGGNAGAAGNNGNSPPPPQPPPPVPPAPPPATYFDGIQDPAQSTLLCSHYQVFRGGDSPCGSGGSATSREKAANKDVRLKRDIRGSVSAETSNDRARNNMSNGLIDSFEGWQQYFAGIDKSPTTIDMNPIELSYPNHMTFPGDSKRPQLGPVYGQNEELKVPVTDIGTDDEVLKTSMAVYQPLKRLRKDFLEDANLRDKYLESALTVRGIAVMTMGFLDKTVGAGLTAVQQQADQNTIQELLKQVSWTTSKLANPDRAQLYRDTDEKLEACLEYAITNERAEAKTSNTTRKIVDFTCSDSCGPPPAPRFPYRDKGKDGKKEGNGSYSYCVCCAETKHELNKLREKGSDKSGYKERTWSLAERAFYGTNELLDGTDGGKSKAKVEKMVRVFREMYGDVVLEDPAAAGAASKGEPYLRYVYVFPKFSVQRRIDALRDGCYYCEGSECKLSITGDACPLRELGMTYGICPAASKILKEWDTILARGGAGVTSDIVTAWLEASMGGALSGRSFRSMLSLTGNDAKSVEEPGGKLRRFLDAWCDASARAAFVRYHTQLSAIFGDHLTLNRQITDADRARMIDLISRVSSALSLSQADEDANASVEAALTGLSVQNDREKASETAAAVAANINGINNSVSRRGEVSSFGKLTELFSGEGAATARDSGVARYGSDPIDTVTNELR